MQSTCATAQRLYMKGGGHSMLVALLGIGIAILLLQVATAAVAEIRFRDVRQIMLGKDDANETDQDAC